MDVHVRAMQGAIAESKKLSLPPGYTTHMDVGNADFAWSKNLPSFLGHKKDHAGNQGGQTSD
jgi:hypothetical protein